MKRNLLCAACLALLAAASSRAEGNAMPETEKSLYNLVEAAFAEGVMRETMITNPPLALKALFTADAANKWRTLTEPNFSREQLRDFFVGTVQLCGPVNDKGAVAGFYNPWWDAILVMENYGETVAVTNGEIQVRKTTDFRFLSGESFRGEPHLAVPSAEAVLSTAHLLPMTLASLTAKTRARFDGQYGGTGGIPLLADHPDSDAAENLKEIQTRSALRLKMVSRLLKDKERYKEAWQLAKLLRDGKKATFNLIFSSDYAKTMTAKFLAFPPEIRKGFEPYAYYPSADGSKVRTYAFVNVGHPRLFAVAHLGLGLRKTVFEWFDLARAGEIEAAFRKAEEVRK